MPLDDAVLQEFSKMYSMLDDFKQQIFERITKLEAKLDMMPTHQRIPCDTACDLVRRVAVLEAVVSEHHRKSEADERDRRGAILRGVVTILAAAVIGAGSVLATMLLHHPK
jgi:hypothetical protein